MYRHAKVAIVVPAFNEEELIRDTLSGIPEYVDRIYVVNDGSQDRTEERIRDIASKDGRFVLINHESNRGVGAAIVSGYSRSYHDKMDITAVMAGDNQMDPLELPKLLDPIINGEADYTKGHRLQSRATAKGMSDWRYLGNNLLTFMTRFAAGNNDINDPQNGYTAINNEVFKTMKPESIFTWYGYCNDMLVKLSTYNYKIKDVVIPARYGNEKSKIAYPKYIIRISRLLFNELIWRLNYQNMNASVHKANRVMAIGGSMSIMGVAVALLSLITPLSFLGTTKPAESPISMLIVLSLVGLGMAYIGFKLKMGGKFGIEGKKI